MEKENNKNGECGSVILKNCCKGEQNLKNLEKAGLVHRCESQMDRKCEIKSKFQQKNERNCRENCWYEIRLKSHCTQLMKNRKKNYFYKITTVPIRKRKDKSFFRRNLPVYRDIFCCIKISKLTMIENV